MAECGCKLIPCDDERDKCDLCSEATGMMDGIGWRIEYCPLHAAAEKMRDALIRLVVDYQIEALHPMQEYIDMGEAALADAGVKFYIEARAAAKGEKP